MNILHAIGMVGAVTAGIIAALALALLVTYFATTALDGFAFGGSTLVETRNPPRLDWTDSAVSRQKGA